MYFKDAGGFCGQKTHSKPYQSLCESAQRGGFFSFRPEKAQKKIDISHQWWYHLFDTEIMIVSRIGPCAVRHCNGNPHKSCMGLIHIKR